MVLKINYGVSTKMAFAQSELTS